MADYEAMTRAAARKYGLDPNIFVRQIRQESGFNPNARSPAGAAGIAQLMPGTAASWGVDPMDPRASLNAAAKNMADYVRRYGGYENALRAYNAGPGAIERSKSYSETNNYVRTILGGSNPTGLSTPRSSPSQPADDDGSDDYTPPQTVTTTTPGVDNRQARAQLILSFLNTKSDDPVAFAMRANQLRDVPATTSTSMVPGSPPSPTTSAPTSEPSSSLSSAGPAAPVNQKGTANFEGKTVAAWIAPALQYARQHGWKGNVISGFRSFAEQTRIYNSGVRPAAVPGTSNHEGAEFPRGAVDVSESQQLSNILKNSPYGQRLKWAGGKDPPHFSYPHNGSY